MCSSGHDDFIKSALVLPKHHDVLQANCRRYNFRTFLSFKRRKMTYFPKKGVWKKDNQWDVILFWFSAVFHCTRNSTSLAKSPNHLVQDHQFTVSFLPFVRCVLHSCSAYDTCLDKLGIQCNFHDLGGQSRFFEWLGWSVKGHTVEWRQTLTLVFVPSPSSMRKCKVFYGKCQTQCLAHMQKAVISKWALDRGEPPPPHTHTLGHPLCNYAYCVPFLLHRKKKSPSQSRCAADLLSDFFFSLQLIWPSLALYT